MTIKDYIYKPATITVPEGTTVNFTNEDSTAAHGDLERSRAPSKAARSTPARAARSRSKRAGTFAYYCVFHPFMKGTIVVE